MEGKTIELSGGVVAKKTREGKGRDIFAAKKMCGGDPDKIALALVCLLYEFDGQKKALEDVEEMPLLDVMKLLNEGAEDFL